MKVVIVGAGSVGSSIARELLAHKHEILLLDLKPEVIGKSGLRGAHWLVGDACELSTLQDAKLEDADVVVSATGDDKVNLVVSLLAKTEFGVGRTVGRVNNPKNDWMFNDSWGVDVAVNTPQLMTALKLKNPMAVPRLEKIVINMGLGEAIANAKIVDTGADEIRAITGQKPVTTRAKKSIASFKLRQGMPIGTMVTLRGDRMYEFLDRLVSVALPRVRDFRGVSPKAFDGRGNYTLGIRDQLIFPEIDFNKVDKTRGMNISIVTTARDDEQARALLKALGMPFRQ